MSLPAPASSVAAVNVLSEAALAEVVLSEEALSNEILSEAALSDEILAEEAIAEESLPTDSIITDVLSENVVVPVVAVPPEPEPAITRITAALEGVSDGNASSASISSNGRFTAFSSTATNVVEEDTNGVSDIFVYDRLTQTTQRVSTTVDGDESSQDSYRPDISKNGRYVAFETLPSRSTVSLTSESTGGIFVYDRTTDSLKQADVSSDDEAGNKTAQNAAISARGEVVAFTSSASNLVADDTNNKSDIFVRDRTNQTTERVSVGINDTQSNGGSDQAAVSASGRYVAFTSYANNLVSDDTNKTGDVFVFDRQTKTTERVSIGSNGEQGNGFSNTPKLSGNGRYVSYTSSASNLVDGDTNGVSDVFVYDRQTRMTERVSIDSFGDESNGFSFNHGLSADGQYVTYSSVADNLVVGDTNGSRDVFTYHRSTKVTQQISVNDEGAAAGGNSTESSLSADGRFTAFQSKASNLSKGDLNLRNDIFIFDREATPATNFAERTSDGMRPIGAVGQNGSNQFVDLREVESPTLAATIEVLRDAGYNNTVGFYAIENDQGGVTDTVTGELLLPGDVGYVKAAIAQRMELNLTGTNNEATTYTTEWATGSLFSTFIVSNGTIESLLDDGTVGDPDIFFSSIGANSDQQQHVRMLADNTFGYEDIFGGGDKDFNDMIVSVKFDPAALAG